MTTTTELECQLAIKQEQLDAVVRQRNEWIETAEQRLQAKLALLANISELEAKIAQQQEKPESKSGKKLQAKIEQKDLHITSLQNQISSLKAQNAALVGDDPEKKSLYEIREHIRLLQEDIKARENQALFQIFGKETEDQLDTLARRYDYFDESYKRIQAQDQQIKDLSRQAETSEKWRTSLREAIDRASAEAVKWQERALKAENQHGEEPKIIELKAEIQRLTEELDITKQQQHGLPTLQEIDNMRRIIEENLVDHHTIMNENTDLQEHITRLLDFIELRGWNYERETAELSRATEADQGKGRVYNFFDTERQDPGQIDRGSEGSDRTLETAYSRTPNEYTRAELEQHFVFAVQENTTLKETIEQKDEIIARQQNVNRQLQQEKLQYINEKAWIKALWQNDKVESARKVGEVGLRWMIEDQQNEHGYAPIVVEQLGEVCGFSRQTASRVMHESIDSGAHSAIVDLEECVVKDKRRGERKIEKTHYSLAETRALEHPGSLKKAEGKQKQGGSLPRCKKCDGENTLKHIYHTLCTVCGYEDVYYDNDALLIKDRFKHEHDSVEGSIQEPEEAPAARQIEQTSPTSETETIAVHLEQETPLPRKSKPDLDTEIMTIARSEHYPALSLPEINVKIAATEHAWTHWMWMSRPTIQQRLAVHAQLTGTIIQEAPAPWDEPCGYCGGTETIYDPDGSGRRICACYTHPEWRKSAQPVSQQKTKAVDFSRKEIIEVSA